MSRAGQTVWSAGYWKTSPAKAVYQASACQSSALRPTP
jgi:hypothetical protein